MSSEIVILFLGLLALAAQVAILAAILLMVAGRFSPAVRQLGEVVAEWVRPQALSLAFLVAAIATVGSLYLSEVAHFVPCRLCWYQRAAMYPLVPLLAVAGRRESRSPRARRLAVLVSVLGALIGGYHVALQWFPTLEGSVCDPAIPCTLVWVRTFGYLSIPTMALSAFVLIAVLLLTVGLGRLPVDQDLDAVQAKRLGLKPERPQVHP